VAPRKVLGSNIAGAREGEDLPSLVPGDLRHNVSRGSEAVDAKPPGSTGFHERAVADETCGRAGDLI
jgi:hypothetical protein